MKKIAVLIVLLTSFFLTAMSDSPKEEPKKTELLGPQVEVQSGEGFITQEELHRIAINVYKYEFEEEHEWKNLRKKENDGLINNIIPIKENSLIIAYIVNFNPTGHIVICANKNFGAPVDISGSQGHWNFDLKGENFLSSFDSRLHPMIRDAFHRMKAAYDEGKDLKHRRDQEFWDRYNVPVDSFNLKADYENNTYKPDWWLEKKKSKNTDGMIKTEWHQSYPFYNFCPVQSDTTLVGCSPLAMSQLMKYYSYPPTGLETLSSSTYDWANMLAYDSLMTTSTYRDAVAQICYDAGVATNAIWGTDSTSVFFDYLPAGLGKFFNYTTQLKSKASWEPTIDVWIFKLMNSITEGKPVLYGGSYSDAGFSGKHTWIIDQYNSDNDRFHFNMGWENITLNDWYQTNKFLTSQYAVFNIIPDKNDNCLNMPYKEDFQGSDVITGSGINQIPKNISVSHTVAVDSFMTMYAYNYDVANHLNAMKIRSSGDSTQWFALKKINIKCDSVPVLKFKYRIKDQSGLSGSGTDAIVVEVSRNNRKTWNQVYKLDKDNYQSGNFDKFVENIVSLNEFKTDTVNIRFRFQYSENLDFCYIDDIEIGLLELSFPELTNNMTLSPKTAQSVKVTPSIYTPPKSKSFEEFDMIMDFYVKEDIEEADYALAFSDSVLENGVFEYPDLNTDDYIGKNIKVRAVARTKSSSLTLKSAEISLKISGRQCRIDLPLPATESWFDFETRLNSAGSILAEPSFADSLSNIYVWFDIYDDYWSQMYSEYYQEEINISVLEQYYYDWEYDCDSTAYFCEFEKKSAPREYRPNREIITDKSKLKRTRKLIPASDLIKNTSDSKDLTVHQLFTYRYPISLNLYPGTYTVFFGAIRKDLYDYDETVSEIAKCDSLQFIIPQWKMKLRRDYWFANTEVPYKQNLEYEAGKVMDIIFWRPWYLDPYYPLYLNIERETDHQVIQNYQVDFNTKASYDLIQWTIPSETVPGFYNLKASNVDYYTDIPVNQQIDPQVCPLYLSWENSGNWPTNWPGSDSWDWEIHPGTEWTPAQGAYAMGAKYSTEGNTGKLSIEKSISIDSQWDKVLEFAIGLEKGEGATNFDPLLANYSIATSKDGANWVIEKTANVSDYTSITWGTQPAHCFRKTFKPLGNISNFGIKFIKEGIVTSPPDSQIVLFDEVKVDLSKIPPKAGPTDPSAQYAGGNVTAGWSGASKGDKALDNYYIYRNGIKIGETMAESFVDSTVSANTFYNYAITAHYDDGSLFPESPMNECTVSIYTGLFSPSNLVITNETPNIRLTWSAVTGASEYKVYSSDDPYGTFAEDTTGTFDGEEWTAPISTSKLFYYVVAVNESMKEKKIIEEETLSRVK